MSTNPEPALDAAIAALPDASVVPGTACRMVRNDHLRSIAIASVDYLIAGLPRFSITRSALADTLNTLIWRSVFSAQRKTGVSLHISATITHIDVWVAIDIKLRNARGKYVRSKSKCSELTQGFYIVQILNTQSKEGLIAFLDTLIKRYADLSGEDRTDESMPITLPEPIPLNKPAYATAPFSKLVRSVRFYRDCQVKGVVTIGDRLRLTPHIDTPDAECWFLISGHCAVEKSHSRPEMVVKQDPKLGMVFLPVRNKFISVMQLENTYINYELVTEADRRLIELAITAYLNG